MRSPLLRSLLLSVLLPLAACGGEAESAAPQAATEPTVQSPDDPWAAIPADSLYGATARENVRVTRAVLDVAALPAGWEGLRVAALSEFQLGLWEDNEAVAAAAVQRAVSLNPDLVVLLGDYLYTGADTAALARVLAPLRGRPVFAVLGERDVRDDSLAAAVTRTLQAQGIRVLDNEAAPFTHGGTTASIAGVDPELVTESWGDQEYILATLGSGTVPLLLTHFPALAARAPEGKYQAILGGNTACGQVEVPGAARLGWLADDALPGAAVPEAPRLFRVEGALMFVTCGVGYSFVPVRAGSAPEVALVTLQSPAAPAAVASTPAQPDSLSPEQLLQRYQGGDTAAAAADTAR